MEDVAPVCEVQLILNNRDLVVVSVVLVVLDVHNQSDIKAVELKKPVRVAGEEEQLAVYCYFVGNEELRPLAEHV